MLDIVTIGHFVRDLIISPRVANPIVTLGGPPTFVSLVAKKLGVKVGVVSKVGEDFREHFAWLRENDVDLSWVKVVEKAFTTSFVLTYNGDKRTLQLKNRASPIILKDIPSSLQAKAIHIAPVADELSVDLVRKLRNRVPLLSIDPQGFLREFDETEVVRPRKLSDIGFLQQCDVFKSSIEEIKMVTGYDKLGLSMEKVRECGVKTVLVTMGRGGALVYHGEEFHYIPACKPKVFKDPTGAGDAFIGGFLAEYVRGRELLWCCCVGSAAASFVVEEVGCGRFGERDEVYERATEIYGRGIKPLAKGAIV